VFRHIVRHGASFFPCTPEQPQKRSFNRRLCETQKMGTLAVDMWMAALERRSPKCALRLPLFTTCFPFRFAESLVPHFTAENRASVDKKIPRFQLRTNLITYTRTNSVRTTTRILRRTARRKKFRLLQNLSKNLEHTDIICYQRSTAV